ncbi:type II secretion system protein GspM [Thermovibrio sp.]
MEVKVKELIEQYLSSISARERRIILIGLPLLLGVLYLVLVLMPIIGAKEEYLEKRKRELEKIEKLEEKAKKVAYLKAKVEPILKKVERGRELDAVSFVKTVARMSGIELKKVKLLPGPQKEGIEVDRISVSFKESPLNRISLFIFRLENGSYYFRSDFVDISDYDQNGLVSGKITLLFFRGVK